MKLILKSLMVFFLPLFSLAQDGFVIKGKVEGVVSGYVSFYEHRHDHGHDHDHDHDHDHPEHSWEKVKIVNGEFTFRGKMLYPDMVDLKISTKIVRVFLENKSYTINTTFKELDETKLNGGGLHQEYLKYISSGKSVEDYIKANPNSELSAYIAFKRSREKSGVESLYKLLGEKARNSHYGKELYKKVQSFQKVSAGSPVPSFEMEDPSGKKFSVNDIKGKVVVLDFWASWCAPCRGFVPTMRKYYKEFKDKGVEFIAVSFDDDKIKWEDAMNSLKMEWKQGIVEGGFGANSPVKNMFQIKSIPHIVVIGKDGKIAETLDFYTKEKLPELLTKLTS